MERDNCALSESILSSATAYAILAVDLDGRIITWNRGAVKLFGWTEAEMLGRPLSVLSTEQDRAARIPEMELTNTREKGRTPDMRMHLRKDGSRFWVDGMMQVRRDATGDVIGYVKILRDATESHRMQAEIGRLARVDSLTGIANRAEFEDRFNDMAAMADRHGQLLILQMIDLDHFKPVNDKFGHLVGDQLLQQVAGRLRDTVRGTDLLARLGGDEFVLLQPDVTKPEDGGVMALEVLGAIARPFYIDGQEVRIGASIGISVFPRDAVEPRQLLRKADLALYKVKARGRGGYQYFSDALDKMACKRLSDLSAVRGAVVDHNFSLVYQPKVSLTTGNVEGVEALLRCHDSALAAYPIEDVIALTVDAGLMEGLGQRVLTEACQQMCKWHDAGLTGLHLCVNACVSEMKDPQFPGNVERILARSGLSGDSLVIEVTEHEIYDSGDTGKAILSALRTRGVLIALDDFGTGFSALSYLTQLRFDLIKLDRSFLRNTPLTHRDCTLISSILSLARALDLKVVAEGVETEEQLAFFRHEQCDMAQGYVFTRPLRAIEMTRWLFERMNVSVLPTVGQTSRPDPRRRHH